jgi:hypothetical protein
MVHEKDHLSRDGSGIRIAELRVWNVTSLFLYFDFTFLEDEILAHDAFPDILYIFDDSLEVRLGVIRASNKNVIRTTIGCGAV